MKTIITATVISFIASMATAEKPFHQVGENMSGGGFVGAYMNHVDKLDAEGLQVRIQTRACISACTFYLGAKDVCISPETFFQFHGPSANISILIPAPVSFMPERQHTEIVTRMANQYDRWAGLGDWFLETSAHLAGALTTTVTGQALHDSFGIPLCVSAVEAEQYVENNQR